MPWFWTLLVVPALELVTIPVWAVRRGHSAWEFFLLTVFCGVFFLPFGVGLLVLIWRPFEMSPAPWYAWLFCGLPAAAALLAPVALLYWIRPPTRRI